MTTILRSVLRNLSTSIVAVAITLPVQSALSQQHDDHKGHEHGQPASAQEGKSSEWTDSYPLATCAVSGEDLGNKPIVKTIGGRELKFCCKDCAAKFESDPAKYTPAIDKKIIAQQLQYYPLDKCVVAGEKLGGMGEPVNFVYRNRLVRFCCDGCKGDFEKNPAASIAVLDEAAIKQQSKTYSLTKCPVMNEDLPEGDNVTVFVVNGRMVKACCEDCEAMFRRNPVKYFARMDALERGESIENKTDK